MNARTFAATPEICAQSRIKLCHKPTCPKAKGRQNGRPCGQRAADRATSCRRFSGALLAEDVVTRLDLTSTDIAIATANAANIYGDRAAGAFRFPVRGVRLSSWPPIRRRSPHLPSHQRSLVSLSLALCKRALIDRELHQTVHDAAC